MMTSQPENLALMIPWPDHSWLLRHLIRHQRSLESRWILYRTVTMSMGFVFLFVNANAQTEMPGPCMGCRLFNEGHTWHSEHDKKETEFCQYPCQCSEDLTCHDGVNVIKDGCGCCYMCARQMGDMCSVRDLCDAAKGLFCDNKDTHSSGVCKGKHKNPCFVHGVIYKDGEKFQPDCSQLCTCQNGFYGCVDICPHELQKPSELTCHEPKLIQVKDKCCKEWTCQKMEVSGTSVLANNGLKSDNLVVHNPLWYYTSTLSPLQETTSLTRIPFQKCYKKTTDWTPCTVTCDVGVSIRIVVDPITCNNYQELQLCYLRPCGINLAKVSALSLTGRKNCTPTMRRNRRQHIHYQDCLSVKDYSLKFCTECRKNKCCYPQRTRTQPIEFQCSDGKREIFNYMWIKKCRCSTTCDLRPGSSRGRGRGINRKRGRQIMRHRIRRRRKLTL